MMSAIVLQMACVAGLLGLAVLAIALSRSKARHGRHLQRDAGRFRDCIGRVAALAAWRYRGRRRTDLADRIAVARRPFPPRCAGFVFPYRRQSGRSGGKPLRSRLRPPRSSAAPRASLLPRLSGRHEPRGAGGRCVFLSAVLGIHVACVLGAGHGAPPRTRQREGGICLSRDGKLRHAGAAAGLRPAGGTGGRLRICRHSRCPAYALRSSAGADPDVARSRFEGRPRAVACLAAARSSGGSQPRFGADERRHDQGRDLRLHSRRLRSAGTADLVGERRSCFSSAASPPSWGFCTP